MSDIELKKWVDQIADGDISKADAAFVKEVFEKANQDKTKNYFQEYVKNNTQVFDKTMQDIAESLKNTKIPLDNDTKTMIDNFIARLKNEKNTIEPPKDNAPWTKKETPNTPTEYKTKVEYKPVNSLQSNIDEINAQLLASWLESKKISMTAEQMRTNLRTNVMQQVEKELKTTLKISDKKLQNWFNSKTEAVYKFLYESFDTELKKNNRLDNLIVAGMYVTINGIKQKMEAPKLWNADFNAVGANILSNIKDINTFLSGNGDIMGNLFKNSQDKIVKKIKENFPKEAIQRIDPSEFKNMEPNGFYVNIGNYKNPISEIFTTDIKIDTELDAIQFIEANNGITEKTTPKKLWWTWSGVEINKQLSQKLDAILKEVPTKWHEQEAFKTELIQNKFSGWSKDILQAVYDFAEKLWLWNLLKLFNKDWLFEKVLLSKSRNDAKTAVEKVFNTTKNDATQDIIIWVAQKEKLKNIVAKLDIKRITKTLNETKKYIKPVSVENGKEKDNEEREKIFMDESGTYTDEKVKKEFSTYVGNIDKNWFEKISSEKPHKKDEPAEIRHQYSLSDIITKDSDLVEHFLQYVQTGLYPYQYSDRQAWENLQNIGIKPETKDDKTPDVVATTPTVKEEPKKEDTPASVEKKTDKKPWEVEAEAYAKKVKNGKVHTSKLWSDSVYVEFTWSKWQVVKKMFKSPNAKKIY